MVLMSLTVVENYVLGCLYPRLYAASKPAGTSERLKGLSLSLSA